MSLLLRSPIIEKLQFCLYLTQTVSMIFEMVQRVINVLMHLKQQSLIQSRFADTNLYETTSL